MKIMITGSSGLIGSEIVARLASSGAEIVPYDLLNPSLGCDIRDLALLRERIVGCDGVIHLAAISRVAWGETEPELCWSTNVVGTRNVLTAAAEITKRPWTIFASSREVYGQPDSYPVNEDAELRPLNVYGRSKVEGERLIREVHAAGTRASILRFSNVYGRTSDHPDRVVPAFCRNGVHGDQLRVDGRNHTFDFTHVFDVARAIELIINAMNDGRHLPPIHLVSGHPTTLGELAEIVIKAAGTSSTILEATPRDFDVEKFWGNPERANSLLGWSSTIGVEEGLTRMVNDFELECRVAKEASERTLET